MLNKSAGSKWNVANTVGEGEWADYEQFPHCPKFSKYFSSRSLNKGLYVT